MKTPRTLILAATTILALETFPKPSIGKETSGELLPGAKPLTLEGDLAERMLDGAHRYLDRKLEQAVAGRAKRWAAAKASPKEHEVFLQEARRELARILGVTDERVSFEAPSLAGTTVSPAKVATGEGYEVFAIRWPTLDGIFGEGLLLRPVGRKPVADVVVIPDADQTPEAFAGLTEGTPPEAQFPRRLAESGCRVVVPALIDRTIRSHSERRGRVKFSNREFLHRSAFLMGRTLQGYEIQKVLAIVDWFSRDRDARIGVAGWGEGGMLALRASALDTLTLTNTLAPNLPSFVMSDSAFFRPLLDAAAPLASAIKTSVTNQNTRANVS